MREFRTVLLLVMLGGLTIFALQNTSPSLPLVFLGTTSIALPLSVWIVAAIALGAFTAWIVANLFGLYNYWGVRADLPRRGKRPRPLEPIAPQPDLNPSGARSLDPENWRSQATKIQDSSGENWRTSVEPTNSVQSANSDEIDEENWIDEDEEFIEQHEFHRTTYTEIKERDTQERDYEATREPTSESWSGSMYSYSYEQRRKSEEETHAPYEADYAIVTPPPVTPEVVELEENQVEAIAEVEETPPPGDRQTGTEADDWTKTRRRSDDW